MGDPALLSAVRNERGRCDSLFRTRTRRRCFFSRPSGAQEHVHHVRVCREATLRSAVRTVSSGWNASPVAAARTRTRGTGSSVGRSRDAERFTSVEGGGTGRGPRENVAKPVYGAGSTCVRGPAHRSRKAPVSRRDVSPPAADSASAAGAVRQRVFSPWPRCAGPRALPRRPR